MISDTVVEAMHGVRQTRSLKEWGLGGVREPGRRGNLHAAVERTRPENAPARPVLRRRVTGREDYTVLHRAKGDHIN